MIYGTNRKLNLKKLLSMSSYFSMGYFALIATICTPHILRRAYADIHTIYLYGISLKTVRQVYWREFRCFTKQHFRSAVSILDTITNLCTFKSYIYSISQHWLKTKAYYP